MKTVTVNDILLCADTKYGSINTDHYGTVFAGPFREQRGEKEKAHIEHSLSKNSATSELFMLSSVAFSRCLVDMYGLFVTNC